MATRYYKITPGRSLNICNWWCAAVYEDLSKKFSIRFAHFHALVLYWLTRSILVDLWPWQTVHFFCGAWIHLHLKTLIYSISAPTVSPTPARPNLNYSLRDPMYAKCVELFSCRTVNTERLWLWAWKKAEENKMDQSEWEDRFELNDRICTWRSL